LKPVEGGSNSLSIHDDGLMYPESAANSLPITSDELFGPNFTLSEGQYDQVADTLVMGAVVESEEGKGGPNIVSQLLDGYNPLVGSGCFAGPMFPIIVAAYPQAAKEDWVPKEGKERLGKLEAGITAALVPVHSDYDSLAGSG
jgi:hypothetical protein